MSNEEIVIKFIKANPRTFEQLAGRSGLNWYSMTHHYVETYGGDMDNFGNDLASMTSEMDLPVAYEDLETLNWTLVAEGVSYHE